jgi:thymidylate kinase
MTEEMPRIEQQPPIPGREHPIPMELRPETTTPVYGSAQPSAGPADQLRRRAYSHPAHDPKRWLLLLAADRAESTGNLAREMLTPGRQALVLRHFGRQARAYQRSYAAAAGIALGGILLRAASRRWRKRR